MVQRDGREPPRQEPASPADVIKYILVMLGELGRLAARSGDDDLAHDIEQVRMRARPRRRSLDGVAG